MPLRLVALRPLFQMGLGGGELTAKHAAGPHGVVGFEQEVCVLQALGEVEELLSQSLHRLIFAALIRHPPESPQHAEELRRLAHLRTQLAGAAVQPLHFWGRLASGCP